MNIERSPIHIRLVEVHGIPLVFDFPDVEAQGSGLVAPSNVGIPTQKLDEPPAFARAERRA